MRLFFSILLFILLILVSIIVGIFICCQKLNVNKISGGGGSKTLTYALKADSGLEYSILKHLLQKHNFKEKDISEPYVDLSWGEVFPIIKNGRESVEYPKEFYDQKADLKFLLHSDEIKKLTEKANLVQNFKNKEFLPKSYLLKDFIPIAHKLLDNKTPYIVKANIGFQQKSVKVVLNYNQLIEAKNKFGINCIVSEYITNPMLSHKKKFHLRPYILLYANPEKGIKKAFTFSQYRIFTAKKSYHPGNLKNLKEYYDDEEIHMSGGHHTDRLLFPSETDIPPHLIATSLKNLKQCTTAIEDNFLALNLSPYPESKSGFQIICADIMLDDKGTPYILEINRRCGFSYGMKYNESSKANESSKYNESSKASESSESSDANNTSTSKEDTRWRQMNHHFSTEFFDWICQSVIFPHWDISHI